MNRFKIEEYDFLKHGNKRFVLSERLTSKKQLEKQEFVKQIADYHFSYYPFQPVRIHGCGSIFSDFYNFF